MTFSSVKPSISPSNVALNEYPGTVLKTVCPEDSKTPSKLIEIDKNLIKSIHFVSKVIDSTFKTYHWLLKNDSF